MIVALIPAHNEEAGIVNTIRSLKEQTLQPDCIIVVADNCTDKTVALSEAEQVCVLDTVGNRHKKAGALNQAIDYILPELTDEDFLLVMDADSLLCETWLGDAITLFKEGMGGLSGAYIARRGRGLISLLQQAEYAQERRRIARKQGHVDVLSGTAALFPVKVLRELVSTRGYVYDINSLTEDFEITLALKSLGYKPRCFKQLRVVTDVMETWGDLYRQRLRWQRGTIETLQKYGWTEHSKWLWLTQVLTYASTFVLLLVLASWSGAVAYGFQFSLAWALILPIFMLEQTVSSWRGGVGARLIAFSLIPMWFYDVFRTVVYWIALGKSLFKVDKAWA